MRGLGMDEEIQQIIYDGIARNLPDDIIEKEEIKKKQIHLYIPNFIKHIKEKMLGFKFPNIISLSLKEWINGILEIFSNIIVLGIAGSFSIFFLLFLLPFSSSVPLVGIIKENLWLEIVIVVLGSGSFIYIFYDIVDFLKKDRKVGK